jgi:hypothetical protein
MRTVFEVDYELPGHGPLDVRPSAVDPIPEVASAPAGRYYDHRPDADYTDWLDCFGTREQINTTMNRATAPRLIHHSSFVSARFGKSIDCVVGAFDNPCRYLIPDSPT